MEYLSSRLGISFGTNNNLALAGSTTTNLLAQVAAVSASTNLQTALFTVWSGANDFAASSAGTIDAAWGVVISNAVMNITNAIGTLYTNSAREIIVGDLFNLTLTPLYNAIATNSYSSNYAVLKVLQFNSELGTAVTNLMQSSPGLRIYFMDLYPEWQTVYGSPATYGFTVTLVGALQDTNVADKSFTGPGANYLYWDTAHPTTKMHSMIGTLAYDLVGVGLNLTDSGTTLNLAVSNLYPGFLYTVQTSSNLLSWTNYDTITAASRNQSLNVTNAPGPRAYYRVKY